jgi:hypothetical protein
MPAGRRAAPFGRAGERLQDEAGVIRRSSGRDQERQLRPALPVSQVT